MQGSVACFDVSNFSLLLLTAFRLIGTRNNLISRVADFVKLDPGLLKVTDPPARMPHAKLTLLRILQVFCFSDTIIEYRPPANLKPSPDGSFRVSLRTLGQDIEESHLTNVLRSERHRHRLQTRRGKSKTRLLATFRIAIRFMG